MAPPIKSNDTHHDITTMDDASVISEATSIAPRCPTCEKAINDLHKCRRRLKDKADEAKYERRACRSMEKKLAQLKLDIAEAETKEDTQRAEFQKAIAERDLIILQSEYEHSQLFQKFKHLQKEKADLLQQLEDKAAVSEKAAAGDLDPAQTEEEPQTQPHSTRRRRWSRFRRRSKLPQPKKSTHGKLLGLESLDDTIESDGDTISTRASVDILSL